MKISGFTMARNAVKYYFPIKESILSLLPIVDEFIVALGKGDEDDNTRAIIESIDSNKIKIIDRVWSEKDYVNGKVLANETTFALSQCSGDWCIYLQADEIIHENDLDTVIKSCQKNLDRKKVDGFLFNYYHFFADYDHYLPFHGWYKNEIRIIRNHANIFSYKDAQSFRKKKNDQLNVIPIDAHIYHYGWVRPPELMKSKSDEQYTLHHGKDSRQKIASEKNYFDYGAVGNIPLFKGSHPKVMKNMIKNLSWKDKIKYDKSTILKRRKMKHEMLKYQLLTFLENNLNNGNYIFGGGYSNWNILK